MDAQSLREVQSPVSLVFSGLGQCPLDYLPDSDHRDPLLGIHIRWFRNMENPWPNFESGQCIDCHLTVINPFTYPFSDIIFHLRRSTDYLHEVVCCQCAIERTEKRNKHHY